MDLTHTNFLRTVLITTKNKFNWPFHDIVKFRNNECNAHVRRLLKRHSPKCFFATGFRVTNIREDDSKSLKFFPHRIYHQEANKSMFIWLPKLTSFINLNGVLLCINIFEFTNVDIGRAHNKCSTHKLMNNQIWIELPSKHFPSGNFN